MTMLLKGPEIDALVQEYCALTGLTNKSAAVRKALSDQIATLKAIPSLSSRIAKIQRRAAAGGFVDAAAATTTPSPGQAPRDQE